MSIVLIHVCQIHKYGSGGSYYDKHFHVTVRPACLFPSFLPTNTGTRTLLDFLEEHGAMVPQLKIKDKRVGISKMVV